MGQFSCYHTAGNFCSIMNHILSVHFRFITKHRSVIGSIFVVFFQRVNKGQGIRGRQKEKGWMSMKIAILGMVVFSVLIYKFTIHCWITCALSLPMWVYIKITLFCGFKSRDCTLQADLLHLNTDKSKFKNKLYFFFYYRKARAFH